MLDIPLYPNADKAFALQWAEDLESGEYEQASQALCDNIAYEAGETKLGYCCLGVAMRRAGVKPRKLQNDTWEMDGESSFLSHDVYTAITGIDLIKKYKEDNVSPSSQSDEDRDIELVIPPELLHKLGMTNNGYPITRHASALNDTYQFSFSDIAQCVRHTFGLPPKE